MDLTYKLNGTNFVWNDRKAAGNPGKHDSITFEQADSVFFDPLFRLVEAGRNDEVRDAIIGFDASSRLLFVVHILIEDSFIRIISARKASPDERRNHEHF